MPSNDGSKESLARSMSMTDFKAKMQELMAESDQGVINMATGLTREEQDRIADGEPYCFRCGKPASSFSEYDNYLEPNYIGSRAEAVRAEEGTYNRDTNRFACDACYIAIGQPSSPSGWVAP